MRTRIAGSLALALALAAPRVATASAISVLGNTDAYECFLSASARSTAVASLDSCRKALAGGDLAARDHAATLVNLGIILNQLARMDEALSAFEKALVMSPNLPEAILSRGNSHFLQKDYDHAIADYELSLQYGVRDAAAAHFNHAMAHGKKKNFHEAARSYQRALEINPGFARARARLDRLHALGLTENAREKPVDTIGTGSPRD